MAHVSNVTIKQKKISLETNIIIEYQVNLKVHEILS